MLEPGKLVPRLRQPDENDSGEDYQHPDKARAGEVLLDEDHRKHRAEDDADLPQ